MAFHHGILYPTFRACEGSKVQWGRGRGRGLGSFLRDWCTPRESGEDKAKGGGGCLGSWMSAWSAGAHPWLPRRISNSPGRPNSAGRHPTPLSRYPFPQADTKIAGRHYTLDNLVPLPEEAGIQIWSSQAPLRVKVFRVASEPCTMVQVILLVAAWGAFEGRTDYFHGF